MTDHETQKDLKRLKCKIKAWESQFTNINQRKPLKEDIQVASSEVKDTYREYWALKKVAELQKINKEDVWSENLNKCSKKVVVEGSSDRIFKKFCSKIRERSSHTNQINIQKCPPKQAPENKLLSSVKSDNDLCNKSLPKVANCDTDFNNLDNEMTIIKPTKKIMKFDSSSKKLTSVNILSSSVDIKNLEKKLSFETFVNSDWLERCYGTVNDSCSNDTFVNNIATSHTDKDCNPESIINQNVELEQQHNLKKSSLDNNFKHFHVETLHSSNFKEYSNNFQDISIHKKRHSIDEIPAESIISNCDRTESERNCVKSSIIEKSELQSTTENEQVSTIENNSLKRKLARTNVTSSRNSSHLERKIASGTLNENFVKVNIKKKKFSRGHKSVNIKKLKWKKWKELKKSGGNNGNVTIPSSCFKCGQVGHWARNCKVLTKSIQQPDTSFTDEEDTPIPTLEEVAALIKKSKSNLTKAKTSNIAKCGDNLSNKISMECTEENYIFDIKNTTTSPVKPIYEPTFDGQPIEAPIEVFDSLKELGFSDFRKGQESAVMRILCGLSTLVVLPTGSGKSLCYQLPAYIYAKYFKCVTLVISPLVSLMEDQIKGLASCLHAICLHSGMTDEQKKASLEDLKNGKAQILLVSPEAVIGGQAYGGGMLLSNMPPIAFACIDEAHCLSQWSHNFRPSYLQLHKVLTEFYKVKCILGLTATANQSTAREIISHLGLKSAEESVIGSTAIPENLHLSVSRDKDRDKALLQLLLSDRFSSCSSIIIYCIRRDETERLATFIRTCLQDQISHEPPAKKTKAKSKKRNFLWTAEAYHAGLAPPRRRSIQKQFMSGKLRVIVATIAFGMGLDKQNVRAIIHYNMPKSFESYVQEIGRAGRDGLDSYCHLFLDNERKDMQELQRFIYSNSTDRYVIRKLLKNVFIPSQCKVLMTEQNQASEDVALTSESELHSKCPKHEIAFSIDETVQELDLKEENILTLLCYLELYSKKWIELLPSTYSTCAIRCYGGPKQLQALASKCLPVAAAFALDAEKNKSFKNISSYEFAVVKVASTIGWNTGSVKRALKNLEWNDQKRKTGVIIEFSNLAFHLCSPCNLSDDELDEALDFLHQKVVSSEKKEILNLKSLHSIFFNYSHAHYWACIEEDATEFSKAIKEAVNKYFDETNNLEDMEDLDSSLSFEDIDVSDVKSQIRDIIHTNNDQNFTGRAIARIFHGIGSPCFPSEVWGRVHKFWRCLIHVNFNYLVKLANEELKRAR